jgi:hypothetical protein
MLNQSYKKFKVKRTLSTGLSVYCMKNSVVAAVWLVEHISRVIVVFGFQVMVR